MCDICGSLVNDPCKRVYMREIFYKKKPCEKQRVHLCEECLRQIAEISRKKRSDT